MGRKRPQDESEDLSDEEEFVSDEEMMNEGDEDEDEDDEQDLPEGGPAPKARKGSQRPDREPIYDVEGLHEKLEDIGWTDAAPWEETLVISHDDPAQVENVDDDISRELFFYNQALSAAQQAIAKFEASNTPWLRPQDYYAEMVKSDEHMAKVKEQLMHEQKAIEQAEERRKTREAKQYSKQVQAEKNKERTQNKKKQIEAVSKMRKQREKSGFAGEVDYDAALKAMERGAPAAGPQQNGKAGSRFRDRGFGNSGQRGATPINKKRQAKDSKFGFGGSKRLAKQNDASSAAAMDGFKQFKDKGGRPGGPGGKGRPSGGKPSPGGPRKQQMKRPGKTARQAKRGGKR